MKHTGYVTMPLNLRQADWYTCMYDMQAIQILSVCIRTMLLGVRFLPMEICVHVLTVVANDFAISLSKKRPACSRDLSGGWAYFQGNYVSSKLRLPLSYHSH